VGGQHLVTDAEVLQEILHRYVAIDRRNAIGPALSLTLKTDVLKASEIVQNSVRISARDEIRSV
jgi:uncharacterized protein